MQGFPPPLRKRSRIAIAILALTGIWSCSEAPGPGAPIEDLSTQMEGAVEASFRVGPFNGGRQSVWVRLTAADGRVGAYQASVSFDGSALRLDRAAMTDGDGSGDYGVLNDGQAEQGLVRFAGFSIEGFDVRDVLELEFETPRPLESGDLTLHLDVVGTPDGAKITPDDLVVTSTMRPVTKLELGR